MGSVWPLSGETWWIRCDIVFSSTESVSRSLASIHHLSKFHKSKNHPTSELTMYLWLKLRSLFSFGRSKSKREIEYRVENRKGTWLRRNVVKNKAVEFFSDHLDLNGLICKNRCFVLKKEWLIQLVSREKVRLPFMVLDFQDPNSWAIKQESNGAQETAMERNRVTFFSFWDLAIERREE